jgi:hypothetical protein
MAARQLTTAKDLLNMGSDAHYELFQGELVWVSYVTPWSNRFTQYLAFSLYRRTYRGAPATPQPKASCRMVDTRHPTLVILTKEGLS